MTATWLHISDIHMQEGDQYDSDVVLGALIRSVRDYRAKGRAPDLIFVTGDIAHSGKEAQYRLVTTLFDQLLDATGLTRHRLHVVPGNHDVDRNLGIGLARTLDSGEEADRYFKPHVAKVHLTSKLGAFVNWYNDFFAGIRSWPNDSTCGKPELVEVGSHTLGILPINSALFCLGEDDHDKLWIGRRPLEEAVRQLSALGATTNIALVHHPLEWLSSFERSNVRATLSEHCDILLRGHLHESDAEVVESPQGHSIMLSAGASYQSRWPKRALYVTFRGERLAVFPIRYEEAPRAVWTVDPSLFPQDAGYEREYRLPRLARKTAAAEPVVLPDRRPPPRFRSNITARFDRAFVGRQECLAAIREALADTTAERVVVLNGPPGVGKSELAREYARKSADLYPGGTFFIEAGADGPPIELARIGKNHLDMAFDPDLTLDDQCLQTLLSVGATQALLIYDNVRTARAVRKWLPLAGMRCHVIITSVADVLEFGWIHILVPPLTQDVSLRLIELTAGPDIANRFGVELATLAGGLPAQLCPAAATLAYEARRGRLAVVSLTLSAEARLSFSGVYDQLEPEVQLLLHGASFLNCRQILTTELEAHLGPATGWSPSRMQHLLDACRDRHLIDGSTELRIHQLFASYVLSTPVPGSADEMRRIRDQQFRRFLQIARGIEEPARPEAAAALLVYPANPDAWATAGITVSIEEGEDIGVALDLISRFGEALPWFERGIDAKRQATPVDHASLGRSLYRKGFALAGMGRQESAQAFYEQALKEKELGDADGVIDHEEIGACLHQIGCCLTAAGKVQSARAWFERAADEKAKGDRSGSVDHENLGRSLHQIGYCHSTAREFDRARAWYERAVKARKQGDRSGIVDHAAMGKTLHQVGYCLSSTRKFEQARKVFDRAVRAKQHPDARGRIDHESVGASLHQIGYCLSMERDLLGAEAMFRRAVASKRLGDSQGRVDHESLGISLHQQAHCTLRLGHREAGLRLFDEAVSAKLAGDIYGRVDRVSVEVSVNDRRRWLDEAKAEDEVDYPARAVTSQVCSSRTRRRVSKAV